MSTHPEPAHHRAVLLPEVLSCLRPSPGGVFLDGTLGLGGHAEAILERIRPGGLLLGLDVDAKSIAHAAARLARFGDGFRAECGNFAQFVSIASKIGIQEFDGILLDLGISSAQIDDPALGLSFQTEMPLDMAYGAGSGPNAADLVNSLDEAELARLFWGCGEEPRARAIAAAIVRRRAKAPIRTTTDLAQIVAEVAPRGRIHPATRVFLSLRVAVNREYENLDRFLEQLPGRLASGARACVISYHSLEDRRVKSAFGRLVGRGGRGMDYVNITPRPIRPSREELASNPRSRSARLRAIGYKL
jgi:16S rRNA (cytosine1402-N4)-methyltransferase